MTVEKLRKLEGQLFRNLPEEGPKLAAESAQRIIATAKDWNIVSMAEKAEVVAMLQRNHDKIDPGIAAQVMGALKITPPTLQSNVLTLKSGRVSSSLKDDMVYFGPDGTFKTETGKTPYSRGFGSVRDGALRYANGSAAPKSKLLTETENAQARAASPGQGLDKAAAAFGVKVNGFEKMAHSPDFFNPKGLSWEGKCHAWVWAALSQRLNKLIDVEGPEGNRGLWIAGNWVSRADLGNWMMAVADTVSMRDDQIMFQDNLSPADLIKGMLQFVNPESGGVAIDYHNDKAEESVQVWNQPMVSSEITVKTLTGAPAQSLLDEAKKDGYEFAAAVKEVKVVGTYGSERGANYEGPTDTAGKTWNIYAVVTANGRLLTAYMTDDVRFDGVMTLPTLESDPLPEYFWKPTLGAIDSTLNGKPDSAVLLDKHAAEFKFFVQTVLLKGVSEKTRAAFEADFAALPAGRVEPYLAQELSLKYPGVANAYSPEQWNRVFQSRGLSGERFGAEWIPSRH